MSTNKQNKNKNKKQNSKSPKSSKIKKIILAGGIIILIIAGSIFIYNKNKSKNQPKELPKIENVQESNASNESDDKSNSNTNDSADNSYDASKDNEVKIQGEETDDAKVAKIAFAIANMVDDTVVSYDYWTSAYNQPTLDNILGDKIKVKFDFSDRETFQHELIKGTGGNAQAMVPVIKDLSADKATGANAQAKIDQTRIKKLGDNQYEATLTLAKTIADNYEGFDPKDLTYTAKEILDDYEEAGTLEDYTDIDDEKVIIEKVDDGQWKAKFARDTWYKAKGGN